MSAAIDGLPDPILIVGAYGYGNVGDEAILAGLLSKIGDRRVTVVSRDPTATRSAHEVASVAIRDAAAVLWRHRSVIIGGGGLFGRDMGAIGRLLPAFGIGSIALGRPVLVDGVDLDASLAPSARLLVPRLMRRAAHVTVRDRRSVAILRAWGVHADLAPDLSAWMPIAPVADGRTLLRDAGIDTSRPVVGLALTAVEPVVADAALAAVTGAMDALPEVQFCFLPMSRHPRIPAHDDLLFGRRLAALRPRIAVVDAVVHPSVVASAFTQLSAIVSMRYHAMLFAERTGAQLVPLVYAEKNLRWLADRKLAPVAPEAAPIAAALHDALACDARPAPRMSTLAGVPDTAGAVLGPRTAAHPAATPIGIAT